VHGTKQVREINARPLETAVNSLVLWDQQGEPRVVSCGYAPKEMRMQRSNNT
jgi:hypothetical protein